MKPVLTPAEASELDRGAQARGVPAETLMERAGRETARIAVELAGGRYGRRAVVVCGKGNNGGDGFVAARYLAGWGLGVSVMLLRSDDELREPAATNLARLRETGARIRGFTDAGLERELARADVVVDAIFGTGFRGTPQDPSAAAIGRLEATGAPVVSVDIPSGVNGESGAVEGPAVSADVTATFGALKAGLVLLPGAERTGIVEVVDIGFPPDLIHADLRLVEAEDVAGPPGREVRVPGGVHANHPVGRADQRARALQQHGRPGLSDEFADVADTVGLDLLRRQAGEASELGGVWREDELGPAIREL